MSIFKRKIGDPLRLRNSIDNGRTDRFVRAFLSSVLGAPIATLDLPHLANGVYGENAYAMPNADQIFVKYRVYKDALFTILDKQYSEGFDLYEKEVLVPVQFPDDSVIGIIDSTPEVSGVVTDSEVLGVISDTSLSGNVDDDEAVGVIGDSDVSGSVDEDEVSGTIQKC